MQQINYQYLLSIIFFIFFRSSVKFILRYKATIEHLYYYPIGLNFPHEENLSSSRSSKKILARKMRQLREENSNYFF